MNDGLALTLQLAMPRPFDLGSLDLAEYGELSPAWRDWETVAGQCQRIAGSLHRRQLAPSRNAHLPTIGTFDNPPGGDRDDQERETARDFPHLWRRDDNWLRGGGISHSRPLLGFPAGGDETGSD